MNISANVLANLQGITSETIKKGYRRPELLSGGGYLKKFKAVPGEIWKLIVPNRLSLPYNPFNPDDTGFDTDLLWGSPFSVTTTVESIKVTAQQDAKVKEFFDKLVGGNWEIKLGEFTEQDKTLFWKNRKPESFVETCMNIKCMGEYGRKVRANIQTDSAGTVIGGDAIYKMHLLARDINNIEYNRVKEEYETGLKKNQPNKARQDALSAVRSQMQIGAPRYCAIAPVLAFKIDNDSSLPNAEDLKGALQQLSFAKDTRASVDMAYNTPFDDQWDYVEFHMTNKADPQDSDLEIYNGRQYDYKPGSRIASVEGFQEAFRALKDENEAISDKVIKKSVPAFNTIDEQFIIDAFAPVLMLDAEKITKEIYEEHSATIAAVSDDLALKLGEKYIDDDMLSIEGSNDKTNIMLDKTDIDGIDAKEEEFADLLGKAGAGLDEIDITE